MINIFKDAIIGDRFITKDGTMMVYVGKDDDYVTCIDSEELTPHDFSFKGEFLVVANDKHVIAEYGGYDIIGKWDERVPNDKQIRKILHLLKDEFGDAVFGTTTIKQCVEFIKNHW